MPNKAEVTKSRIRSMSLVTLPMRSPVLFSSCSASDAVDADMVIEGPPQVVHDPLADISGEIVLQVRTYRPGNSDRRDRGHCKVEDREFTASDPANHDGHPSGQRLHD